jgi:hypothetical protein
MDKKPIAKGRGPVQVHPSMAESFRSEGFGLVSAGLFVKNVISQFNINSTSQEWIIYIDSQSLIKRMATYHERIPIPRWNLCSDEDITSCAHKIIWSKIPHRLVHINSHQEKKINTKLLIKVLPLYPIWIVDPDSALFREQLASCQSG